MRVFKLPMVAVLAVLVSACGLTAPKRHEGFADVSTPGWSDTDRVMSISVGPSLLKFAAKMTKDDDPETAAMLRELDGVRVRIYEIRDNPDRVAGRLDRMKDDLVEDDWTPVAIVRERDESVHFLVRSNEDGIRGLVLLITEGAEEVVIVNVMGDLRPEFFNDVTVALELDTPEVQLADLDQQPVADDSAAL